MEHYQQPTEIVLTNGNINTLIAICQAARDMAKARKSGVSCIEATPRERAAIERMYDTDIARVEEMMKILLSNQPF